LQIAAAGVIERLHGLAVGLAEILVERVEVGIGVLRDQLAAAAEVQHGRRGDRHLRGDMRLVREFLQEAEVIEHRVVVGKVDLADHAHGVMPRLHARELDTHVGMEQLAAGEFGEEVEMPPGAAELAVGREPQAGRGLPVHDLLDLQILRLA